MRNISPHFVIPAGTQVVLTEALTLPNSSLRKPGSVAIVIRSPSHNDKPYLLEFADGLQVEALFSQFVLRRQEIESLLSVEHEDFRSNIVYQCRVGSRAFGLANQDSDDDLRGIFLPSAERHWSLYKLPEQVEWNQDGNDEVYWELEKFVRLALKANPNILETLWTPDVVISSDLSTELRSIRQAFLSKHVFKTYSGYVLSQFRRMKNSFQKKGTYKTKHAMHLIRLQYSGIAALETGEIQVDVSRHRDFLLGIRNGDHSFEEVSRIALDLEKKLQSAYEITHLPEQPDFETVNQFVIKARINAVDRWNDTNEQQRKPIPE